MISRSALAPCLACAPESVPLLIEDSVIVFLCLLNELLLSCLGRDRLRGRLSISRLFLLALRQRACLGRVRPVKVSRDPVEVFSNLTVLLSFCCCSCLFALVLLPLAAIVDSVKRFLELLLFCSLFFSSSLSACSSGLAAILISHGEKQVSFGQTASWETKEGLSQESYGETTSWEPPRFPQTFLRIPPTSPQILVYICMQKMAH